MRTPAGLVEDWQQAPGLSAPSHLYIPVVNYSIVLFSVQKLHCYLLTMHLPVPSARVYAYAQLALVYMPAVCLCHICGCRKQHCTLCSQSHGGHTALHAQRPAALRARILLVSVVVPIMC